MIYSTGLHQQAAPALMFLQSALIIHPRMLHRRLTSADAGKVTVTNYTSVRCKNKLPNRPAKDRDLRALSTFWCGAKIINIEHSVFCSVLSKIGLCVSSTWWSHIPGEIECSRNDIDDSGRLRRSYGLCYPVLNRESRSRSSAAAPFIATARVTQFRSTAGSDQTCTLLPDFFECQRQGFSSGGVVILRFNLVASATRQS